MNEPMYRHELKYPISSALLPLLRSRVRMLMRPDPHAGADGAYTIRSLYFDDIYNRCYYENENGTDPREKFRIRIYNASDRRITLECKRKERGKTLKFSCPLTREQTELLMKGQCVPDIENQPPLLRKLTLQMKTRQLRPIVIVEYERIPFVFSNGNVRITFDLNISSSDAVEDFLEPTYPRRPIMPAGQHLMEVKFDEFLPDAIYRSLNLGQLQQTAFSKYYLCRRFSLRRKQEVSL